MKQMMTQLLSIRIAATKKVLMAATLVLGLSACQKDLSEPKGNQKEELDLENLFDFSTAQTVSVDVKYDVSSAKTQLNFEIYMENPLDQDGVKKKSIDPVFTGKTAEGGHLSCTVDVAAATEKIYIYSPNVIAPTLVVGDIVNKWAHIAKATEYKASPAARLSARAATSGSYYKDWSTQSITTNQKLGSWDGNGLPNYLLADDIKLSDDFRKMLDKLLPSDDNMDATTFLYQTLTLKEKANVDLYFVSHANSARRNALAYYTFTGDHPTQDEVNKSLTVIFPNLAAASLKEGKGVRLKYSDNTDAFPAGSTIGWVLLVDAFKEGGVIENPCNALYSKKKYNSYNFTGNNATYYGDRPHMGAFRSGDAVVLSFEDQPWGSGKPANFRDDVFVLKTNPIEALPDDIEDPDKLDKMTTAGVYAFEDNWPAKKDYDLNDVMVKYQTTLFYKAGTRGGNVTGFDYTFDFLHSGAVFQNAFGFQINDYVLRDNIDAESTVVLADASFPEIGLDPELGVATFMVFKNGKESANKKVTLKIRLKTPLSLEYFYGINCNPFIVVKGLNEMKRTEVHLRNYKPTEKINMDLFHTESDLSDVNKKLYYVSNDYYPFALDVRTTDEFSIPVEDKPIEYTYPQFADWAKSQGKQNKEWYKYPNQ